jgi:hypothetical protein
MTFESYLRLYHSTIDPDALETSDAKGYWRVKGDVLAVNAACMRFGVSLAPVRAIKRCKALQNQDFDRILLRVFQKGMENVLAAARSAATRDNAQP